MSCHFYLLYLTPLSWLQIKAKWKSALKPLLTYVWLESYYQMKER